MAKTMKQKKEIKKYAVLFLVEGDSDMKALQLFMEDLFDRVDPRYQVIFAKMKHLKEEPKDSDDDPPDDLYNENGIDAANKTAADENPQEADAGDADEDPDDDEDADQDADGADDVYDYSGDVTTFKGIWPKRLDQEISNRFFVPIIHRENVYARNLLKVIHIVDLDGAYLPDKALTTLAPERADTDGYYYNTEAGVIEGDPEHIKKRNFHKRCNLDALVDRKTIFISKREVPYAVYFFSSNLDHVLHNEPNLKEGKVKKAVNFAMQFLGEPYDYCDYFKGAVHKDFEGLGYEESWELVRDRKKTYSIQRHTNLHILLNEILNGEFPLPN